MSALKPDLLGDGSQTDIPVSDRALFQPLVSDETIQQVLSILEKQSARQPKTVTERRAAKRYPYRSRVIVLVRNPRQEPGQPATLAFVAWTRDISTGGMGLLVSRELSPVGCGSNCQLTNAASFLQENTECYCGLVKPDGKVTWIRAKIVRIRDLNAPVLCVGVQFLEKAHPHALEARDCETDS